MMSEEKIALRKHFLALRRSLSATQRSHAATRACFKVAKHPWFKRAKHVTFYWPNKSEISPLPLMHLALRLGKKCYLPRVISKQKMIFHLFSNKDHLVRDEFGLAAPRAQRSTRNINKMDLIIMPLVAFDRHGSRLGMGGGFYDRALKHYGPRPRRVGLAYQQQLSATLPHEPWDIKLNAIATDTSFYTCQFRQ